MERGDDRGPIFLRGFAKVGCGGFCPKAFAQSVGDCVDVVLPRSPDDDFALDLFDNIHKLVQAVVLERDQLVFVGAQEAAAYLLQAHDLGQDGLGGGQLAAF